MYTKSKFRAQVHNLANNIAMHTNLTVNNRICLGKQLVVDEFQGALVRERREHSDIAHLLI